MERMTHIKAPPQAEMRRPQQQRDPPHTRRRKPGEQRHHREQEQLQHRRSERPSAQERERNRKDEGAQRTAVQLISAESYRMAPLVCDGALPAPDSQSSSLLQISSSTSCSPQSQAASPPSMSEQEDTFQSLTTDQRPQGRMPLIISQRDECEERYGHGSIGGPPTAAECSDDGHPATCGTWHTEHRDHGHDYDHDQDHHDDVGVRKEPLHPASEPAITDDASFAGSTAATATSSTTACTASIATAATNASPQTSSPNLPSSPATSTSTAASTSTRNTATSPQKRLASLFERSSHTMRSFARGSPTDGNDVINKPEYSATKRIMTAHCDQPREEQLWEALEDDVFILVCGDMTHLQLFQALFSQHEVRRSDVLISLAYVVSHKDPTLDYYYYDCISTLAGYLSCPQGLHRSTCRKHGVLRTLVQCRGPAEAMWQYSDRIIEDTLEFLLCDEYAWDYPPHSEIVLLSELRAMCRFCLEKEERQRQLVEDKGDAAIIFISGCAKLIEAGISEIVLPVVCTKLDDAVDTCKDHIRPNIDPLIVSRDAIVAMTYTGAAKQASESVHSNTKDVAENVKLLAEYGFTILTTKIDGNTQIIEALLPHAPSREVIKVIGKICITSIGAAAIVGEAVIQGSRVVIQKTAHATADLIEHKYGTSAAQIVRDTGDTASNVMGAFGHVAFLKARVVAKAVAQQSTKDKVNEDARIAAETLRAFGQQSKVFMRCLIQGDALILLSSSPAPAMTIPSPSASRDGGLESAA